MKNGWNAVMSADYNPLAKLPKTTRFQLMVTLALMWSIIFCTSAGLFAWLPHFIFAHAILLAAGIFGTGYIFRVHSE